jgi:hypothetical protein
MESRKPSLDEEKAVVEWVEKRGATKASGVGQDGNLHTK